MRDFCFALIVALLLPLSDFNANVIKLSKSVMIRLYYFKTFVIST